MTQNKNNKTDIDRKKRMQENTMEYKYKSATTKKQQVIQKQNRRETQSEQYGEIIRFTFMDTLCLVKALLLRSWYMQWIGRNPVMLALRLLVTATLTACAVTTCDNT